MMIVICEILILCMIYYEYKKFRIAATPIVILGGVYFLFIPIINTIGVYLHFFKLTDKTIICFTFFIFILFLSGSLSRELYKRKRYFPVDTLEFGLVRRENILWRIYLIGLVAYVISLLQVINRYGIDNTKSNAFGIFAHIGFISRCLLPIIIYFMIKKRKLKYVIAIIVNIIALILFKGKYHLYIAISSFIVIFLIMKRSIKISKLVKIVIITFLIAIFLFISVYTIIPNLFAGDTSIDTMLEGIQFSIKHFFHYIFCPFIASNEYFDNPCYLGLTKGFKIIFNPFDRIIQWIKGTENYYDPALSLWPTIDAYGNTGNVGGIFSETVLNIGYFGTIIYIFSIGVLVYYFLCKTLYRGKRIITSICLTGILMMSFFCNYFSLLPNFECILISYFADIFILDNNFLIGKYKLFKGKIR